MKKKKEKENRQTKQVDKTLLPYTGNMVTEVQTQANSQWIWVGKT